MAGILNGGIIVQGIPTRIKIDEYDYEFTLQNNGDIYINNGYLGSYEIVPKSSIKVDSNGNMIIRFSGEKNNNITFSLDRQKQRGDYLKKELSNKKEGSIQREKTSKKIIRTRRGRGRRKRRIVGLASAMAGIMIFFGVGKNVITQYAANRAVPENSYTDIDSDGNKLSQKSMEFVEPISEFVDGVKILKTWIANGGIVFPESTINDSDSPIGVSESTYKGYLDLKKEFENSQGEMSETTRTQLGLKIAMNELQIIKEKIADAYGNTTASNIDIKTNPNTGHHTIVINLSEKLEDGTDIVTISTNGEGKIDKYLEKIDELNEKIKNGEHITQNDLISNEGVAYTMLFSRIDFTKNDRERNAIEVIEHMEERMKLAGEDQTIYEVEYDERM